MFFFFSYVRIILSRFGLSRNIPVSVFPSLNLHVSRRKEKETSSMLIMELHYFTIMDLLIYNNSTNVNI